MTTLTRDQALTFEKDLTEHFKWLHNDGFSYSVNRQNTLVTVEGTHDDSNLLDEAVQDVRFQLEYEGYSFVQHGTEFEITGRYE